MRAAAFPWSPTSKATLVGLWPNSPWAEIEATFPGVSRRAIGEMARRSGAKRREVVSQRKGSVAPLLTGSTEAWYWIGFLLADGHLSGTGQLVCQLRDRDLPHLHRLGVLLGVDPYPLPARRAHRIAVQDCESSPKLKHMLRWHSRKTDRPAVLPSLTADQTVAVLAGLIDGDGSVSQGKRCTLLRLVS